MNKRYSIYILTNKTRLLYVGFSNNLKRRMIEHKNGQIGGYAKKFKLDQLVYFEDYDTLSEAIETEKWLKGMRRERMVKLIEETNPDWTDLTESLLEGQDSERLLAAMGGSSASRPKRKAPGAAFAAWDDEKDYDGSGADDDDSDDDDLDDDVGTYDGDRDYYDEDDDSE